MRLSSKCSRWKYQFILTFFREGLLALYAGNFLPFLILFCLNAPYHLGFGSVVIFRPLLSKRFSVNRRSCSVWSPSKDLPEDRGVWRRSEKLEERMGRPGDLKHHPTKTIHMGGKVQQTPLSAHFWTSKIARQSPKGKNLKNKKQPETGTETRAVLGASAKLVCCAIRYDSYTQVIPGNVCKSENVGKA